MLKKEDVFDRLKIHRKDVHISDEPVSVSELTEVIDSARWAPSPFNSQPWEFLVIDDPSLKKHIEKVVSAKDASQWKKLSKIISGTSVAVAILYDTTRMDPGSNAEQMGLLCLGTCLGNFFLKAAELSIKLEFFRFSANMRKEKEGLEKKLELPKNIKLMSIIGMQKVEQGSHVKTSIKEFKDYIKRHVYHDSFKGEVPEEDTFVPQAIKNKVLGLVSERKSYRKHHLPKDIDKEHEMQILKASYNSNCIIGSESPPWKFILIKNKEAKEKLAKRIQKCAYDAYMDKEYFQKMKVWMRFSEREMKAKKDGVFSYIYCKYVGFLVKIGVYVIELPLMSCFKKLVIPIFAKAFFHDLVLSSPFLLTIIHKPSSTPQEKEKYEEELIAVGMAIQSILLSSWALRIGVQFLSILFNEKKSEKEIQKELNIPEGYAIVDMIRMGYVDPKAVPPQYFTVQGNVRREVSEILHQNSYGTRT